MPAIGRYGSWTLAMGMDWLLPANSREEKTAKKAHPKQSYVLAPHDGQKWLGFHPSNDPKAYSAALLVGLAVRDAIVFTLVNEAPDEDPNASPEAWVCAIQDGMPVVGYDHVLPVAEARNAADEWVNMNIFPTAEIVGALPEAKMRLPDLLEQLGHEIASRSISAKQLKAAQLRTSGLPVARIAQAAAIAAVGAGCVVGFNAYRDMVRREAVEREAAAERARLEAAGAKTRAELEQMQKARGVAFQAEVDAARAQARLRAKPADLWRAFTHVREQLPVSMSGYRPQSIDCTLQACEVRWLGQGRFTSPMDKAGLPGVVADDVLNLEAISRFSIEVTDEPMPAMPAEVVNAEQLQARLQLAFLRFPGALQIEGAAAPQIITPPAGLAVAARTISQMGKWRLRVPGSTALVDAPLYANMLANLPVRVTSVRYQRLDGGVELAGEFVFLAED